jgi:2-methylcitrate dehydratase PrpD
MSFHTKWDEAELPRGLGEEFLVLTTVLKRYLCHTAAHPVVKAVRDMPAAHGFRGAEVEAITVTGTPRMVARYNIPEPASLMPAQSAGLDVLLLATNASAVARAIQRGDPRLRPLGNW